MSMLIGESSGTQSKSHPDQFLAQKKSVKFTPYRKENCREVTVSPATCPEQFRLAAL